MISQKCPRCSSNRVRRGYRKTPIYMKLVGRYYLLCDACNWEFTGFALPGTVTAKSTRKKPKEDGETGDSTVDLPEPKTPHNKGSRKKFRKRIKVRS